MPPPVRGGGEIPRRLRFKALNGGPTIPSLMTAPLFQPRQISPTDEQRAIQADRHRWLIVEANAGAAKTTTLALRIAQALEEGLHPSRILALTYTPAAVTALRQALDRIGVPAALRSRLSVSTFDEFCSRRLAEIEGPGVARYDTPELLKPQVLQALARLLDDPEERHPERLVVPGNGEAAVEGLLATFTWLKGTMLLQHEAAEQSLTPGLADELGQDYTALRAFVAYEALRRGGHEDRHAFRSPGDATYDLAMKLVDDDAVFGERHPLEGGLHLLAVDEMHDTNRAMFTVLRHLLLRNPEAAFIGVGDRGQVIHAVAGADAAFMASAFEQEIGAPARLTLTDSYRFGPRLAQAAGRVAGKPCSSRSARDTEVVLVPHEAADEASRCIADAIVNRTALAADAPASEIAVLLRQPHQSVALENHLLDRGIDYRTEGFAPYLMRPEVLFARGLMVHARGGFEAIETLPTRVAMLEALMSFSQSFIDSDELAPGDRVRAQRLAIEEVAATPQRMPQFVDNHVLRNADPEARQLMEAAVQVVRANTTEVLLQHFLQVLNPHRLAEKVMVRAADVAQVEANLQGLVRSAAGFDSVEAFLRGINERELRQHGMRSKDRVLLAGIEAVKGLEFEHVLIPGLSRGEFAAGGDSADNRNLLYVGITRAKHRLTLLFDAARPSRYLVDAGLVQPTAGVVR